jgi:hypothetical protein
METGNGQAGGSGEFLASRGLCEERSGGVERSLVLVFFFKEKIGI